MIILHQGPGANQRVQDVMSNAQGAALVRNPSEPLADFPDKAIAWLAATANAQMLVVEPAAVKTPDDGAVFKRLKRIVKFTGIDLHLIGDDTVRDIGDLLVNDDGPQKLENLKLGDEAPNANWNGRTLAPFRKVDRSEDIPTVEEVRAMTGLSQEDAEGRIGWIKSLNTWVNDLYQVDVELGEGTAHLVIRRMDKAPVREWTHMQDIKNQLLGPECEAVELYPPESQLVDARNQYHLWGFTDPEGTFGVGFRHGREVEPTR